MIKSELISLVSRKLGNIPEETLADAVNYMLEHMSTSLSEGQRIELRGFGSFSLHYRPPRNAHNPKTGVKVITQAKYSPHFKPGKELRDRVNENRHIPLKDIGDDDEDD